MRIDRKCKVFFVSPEVYPFAKTGGLADVAGSLPKALFKIGHEVKVALPFYKKFFPHNFPLNKLMDIEVPVGGEIKRGTLYQSLIDGRIPVLLFSQEDYFNREALYGDEHSDFQDNAERFSYFCKAILFALKKLNWRPDIIHCNDWQTALVPLYLKVFFSRDDFYRKMGTLFTIHNLAYQGIFSQEKLKIMGLGNEFFTMDTLEFYGKINTMKAGLLYADLITTVSPTYSSEIQTPEYGCGLDGVLRKRRDDLYGVLNGIDYAEWDPLHDKELVKNYSVQDIEGKKNNKKFLQKENNFPQVDVPLVGFISRLAEQKGVDLIVRAIDEMMSLPLQFVVLGTGDARYNRIFEKIGKKFPQKTGIHIGFDLSMARGIYAGADIFLMPSGYEPCGLGQMISMRYGTVPVVRKTGGLADTVKEFDFARGEGNGFLFEKYSSNEMMDALKKAIDVYQDKDTWIRLVKNGMGNDFSWEGSAREYERIYGIILNKLSSRTSFTIQQAGR
ncbi:glycogen synthase GlgA [Candidatus Aerophobetes bacterium]|nr:glycogen synthase GlgA [Candidatus Aerophobetes bacterium]